MKPLFINPPIRLTDKPRHIPHGLAILANLVRSRLGITSQFLDLNALRCGEERVPGLLREFEFDVVLIGGLIPVYKRIVTYAHMIRAINPRAIIVAGGSAAMSVPELLLCRSEVDVVCAGEGEQALIELLRVLSAGTLADASCVRGLYIRQGAEIHFTGKADLIEDLDRGSAAPAYDLLPMGTYMSNPVVGLGRDIDFISSRGCPYQCTFCYQPWGRRFRAHSVEFVLEAIELLRREHRIDFVSFQDDEFMADPGRVIRFCELVQSRAPGLLWSCTGRANLINEEIVSAMRAAGCVSISYGFESGSPRMLASMNKRVTIDQMEQAVVLARRHGMMIPVSFIIGMPGEDDHSCRETVEFCIRNKLPLKSMMYATPYPGTPIFNQAMAKGRLKQEGLHDFVCSLEDARDFVINLTDAFTDDRLQAKRLEMIDEVRSRVEGISMKCYREKVERLFGDLARNLFQDDALLKHRAEHGGIDLF